MINEEGAAFRVWSWIISIALWSSTVFAANIFVRDFADEYKLPAAVAVAMIGAAYTITALCAPTFRYLINTTTGPDIYEYMQRLFYTRADLAMQVKCYHYENRQHEETDAHGNKVVRVHSERVETYTANETLNYVSWRDISGRFVLDTSGAAADQRRAFVKLHIRLEVTPASDGTKADFEQQKQIFRNRNNRDTLQDYSESVKMEGYHEFNFVRVSDFEPSFFGIGWYFIFTLMGGVEFYKMHVAKFCIVQDFRVAKVVSTRRDLNMAVEYRPFVPTIVYMGNVRTYDAPTPMQPPQQPIPPEEVPGYHY